jgi:hypothetical protein
MKFYGPIGYATTVEVEAGVFVEQIVEKQYYGDVIRNKRTLREGENLNPDISLQNSISVVADANLFGNFLAIRYISWMGNLWTVSDVEIQVPRLVLRLGGVYNGPTA